MVISARAIATIGLCSLGIAFLVGPSLGQQPDNGVRRTANPTAPALPPPIPPVIGTVDLDAVFKNYEKVKVSSEEFRAAAMSKKNELIKIQNEAQQVGEMLAKLTPGTDDFKKHENKVTELKARYEAGREQAEREFAAREAEAMATLYKEIQTMVGRVAKWRNMTYVVKVSNQPISGGNPNSVMAAMANTVVYADPRNDITNHVVHNLNNIYRSTSGSAPRSSAAGAAGSGSSAPAGASATGASSPDGN
jgi:Skp family chaperone for outer membrane proteins